MNNILWVLLPACSAIVNAQYEEEEFKITTGKWIRQGASSRGQVLPPAYRNQRSNGRSPYFGGTTRGVNPAYHPVIYGAPTTPYPPMQGQVYLGYPVDQRQLQLYPAPQRMSDRGKDARTSFGSGNNKMYGNDDGGRNRVGFLSKPFIDSINEAQDLWTAVDNFADDPDVYKYVGDICGVIDPAVGRPNILAPVSYNIKDIPSQFDARAYAPWAKCKSLQEIRDQGSCGSCWAVSAVECMTDRICIASGGKEQFHISAQDLLECCTSCGYGCDGGFPGIAWTYFKETGIVTGGEYNSTGADEGCKPYEIAPCAHHVKRSAKERCFSGMKTPTCERSCDTGEPYNENLHFGEIAYSVDTKVESIQIEIMNYGPVQVSFEVYDDFLSYGHGVYFHVNGSKVGDHAVKMLGWGVENKTAYWLCANSWGPDWGLLGGFFKIRRGTNECKIEQNIVAGKPKVQSSVLEPQPINRMIPLVNGNTQTAPVSGTIGTPLGGASLQTPLMDGGERAPSVGGNTRTPLMDYNIGTPLVNGNVLIPLANG